MSWAGREARIRETRKTYIILFGKFERKRPFGRLQRRLVENIELVLTQIGSEDVNWLELAEHIVILQAPKTGDILY
jgi:hypothetical protein